MASSSSSSSSSVSVSVSSTDIITTISAVQGMQQLLNDTPALKADITQKISDLKQASKNPIQLLVDIMEFVETLSKASLSGSSKKEIAKMLFSSIISDPKTADLFASILDVLIDMIVSATKGDLSINVLTEDVSKCCGLCGIFGSSK